MYLGCICLRQRDFRINRLPYFLKERSSAMEECMTLFKNTLPGENNFFFIFLILTVCAGIAFFFLAFLLPVCFCRNVQHTAAINVTQQWVCRKTMQLL